MVFERLLWHFTSWDEFLRKIFYFPINRKSISEMFLPFMRLNFLSALHTPNIIYGRAFLRCIFHSNSFFATSEPKEKQTNSVPWVCLVLTNQALSTNVYLLEFLWLYSRSCWICYCYVSVYFRNSLSFFCMFCCALLSACISFWKWTKKEHER